MTLIADTEANASDKAVAERVRKIREAQDTGVSRAEGWRRRGPLLPALIFMIVVTQIPFLFTLYYSTLSWNLVRPGSRQFVGLNNYIAVVKDSQFWSVALNTVILIVVVVLVRTFVVAVRAQFVELVARLAGELLALRHCLVCELLAFLHGFAGHFLAAAEELVQESHSSLLSGEWRRVRSKKNARSG